MGFLRRKSGTKKPEIPNPSQNTVMMGSARNSEVFNAMLLCYNYAATVRNREKESYTDSPVVLNCIM